MLETVVVVVLVEVAAAEAKIVVVAAERLAGKMSMVVGVVVAES